MLLALIVAAVVAFIASQLYRLLWHRRYLPPPGPSSGIVRLRGRLQGSTTAAQGSTTDRAESGPREVLWPLAAPTGTDRPAARLRLALEDDEGHTATGSTEVRIDEDTPLFGTRQLQTGDRLTVDAVEVSMLAGETLYRQQARVDGLEAIRVMAGAWPRLRWLGSGCAAVVLLLLAVGVVTESGTRTWLLRKTAQKTICLRGTSRTAVLGPQLIQRCVDREGRRQGNYTTWDWSGTLRERGHFHQGRLHGVRDVLNADGSMLRSTFRHGVLDGPTILLGPNGRARRQTTYEAGIKHGVERLWHESGKRAFVGYHAHGLPVGKWQLWADAGQKVAEATMTLGEERWTYFDAVLGGCPGPRQIAERWLDQQLSASVTDRRPCAIRCLPTHDPLSESVSRATCVEGGDVLASSSLGLPQPPRGSSDQ